MKKTITKLFRRYIRPVHCRRCGEVLTQTKARAAGISTACAKLEAAHKAEQVADTKEMFYFFSRPISKDPSPYYQTIAALKSAPGYSDDCRIWAGNYDAAVPVEEIEQ